MKTNSDFYYGFGEITTDKPFITPTRHLIELWSKEWLKSHFLHDYRVLLIGGTLEMLYGDGNYQSKDVDIFIMNDILEPEILYNAMVDAVKLGIKYRLKIDIFHGDNLYNGEEFKPHHQTRFYEYIYYINNRGDIVKKNLNKKYIIKKYECGLITSYITKPKDSFYKHYERTNSGIYTKNFLDLKKLASEVNDDKYLL